MFYTVSKPKLLFYLILFSFTTFFLNLFFKYPHIIYDPLSDTYEYASIARNIVEDKSLTVNNLYSLQLAFPFGRKIPPPSLLRVPFYPLILSGFFIIFGIKDSIVFLCSFVFYILSGVMFYLITRTLNIDKTLSLISLLFFYLNPLLFDFTLRGLSEPVAIFIFLLFVYMVINSNKNKKIFLAGFFLSLFILTRYYISLIYVIPVLYIILTNNKDNFFKHSFLFLLGVILPLIPWFIRNYIVTGNPFFSLAFYSTSYETANIPVIKEFLFKDFLSFLKNRIENMIDFFKTLENIVPFYFFPIGLMYIFVPSNSTKLENLKKFVLISLFLTTFIHGFINPRTRFIFYLYPFFILFTVLYISKYKLFLYFFLSFIFFLTVHEDKKLLNYGIKRHNEYIKTEKVFQKIKELTKKGEFIVTDIDGALGFYCDRHCIFPLTYKEYYEKLFELVPVQGFFVYKNRYKLFYMKYSFKDIEKMLRKKFKNKIVFEDKSYFYFNRYENKN